MGGFLSISKCVQTGHQEVNQSTWVSECEPKPSSHNHSKEDGGFVKMCRWNHIVEQYDLHSPNKGNAGGYLCLSDPPDYGRSGSDL
ncbi:hypothetical protein GDO86_003375 [Hymenochirus boettgeri]|uniref:Uncharacterized protein n=1 Tax=Hymenochirus boettgeri TaxID=247094 RepID=A0A8T2K6S3_9PIPI|nr:hypothetical protein GDO86_003375 [Hymenochirus boettgeri]